MKGIKRIKVVTVFVGCGLMFSGGIWPLPVFAGDPASNAVAKEEVQIQEDPQEDFIGKIDYIGKTDITINDRGYDLTSVTHYRTAGGGVTGKGHFEVGDFVQFVFDPQEMAIIELQMKTRGEQEKNSTKEKNNTGVPVLENGVWTN